VKSGGQRCRQNRFEIETLKAHSRRAGDFTYAVAAEWWEGCGKTAAGNRAFRSDLYKTQLLRCHRRALKRVATALRRTSGKMGAICFSTYGACGRIWIFARRRDGE
jgi:hypothetical protein